MSKLYRDDYRSYHYVFSDGAYDFRENGFQNDYMLIAKDNVATFGGILDLEIPDKGKIFTAFSAEFSSFAKNSGFDTAYIQKYFTGSEVLSGRISFLKRMPILPIKFTVYYHLVGKLYKLYSLDKCSEYGVSLPKGLHARDKLSEPVFLPIYEPFRSSKRAGQILSFEDVVSEVLKQGVIASTMNREAINVVKDIYRICTEFYKKAYGYAHNHWVIIARTSFRIGVDIARKIYFTGEFMTPDSSLFWDAADFYTGEHPKAFGREILEKYFNAIRKSGNYNAPIPECVLLEVKRKYKELHDILF